MQKNKINIALSAFLITFLIIVDQIVKIIAEKNLLGQPTKIYWGGLVQIEYAENRGAFLSLGASLSEAQRFWIFVFGVFFVILFCFYSLVKSIGDRYSVIAFSLVITGGIGNLIDRATRGYVIDYIHMGFASLRTGVFNVADVAISTGVIMLMIQQIVAKEEK